MFEVITQPDLDRIRKTVLETAGIHLDETKGYLVEARLERLARRNKVSIRDLVAALLDDDPTVISQVVDAMTTNETYFFRDDKPFEYLSHQVFPDLLEARASEKALRIWFGAASTGQEPYSTTMLLDAKFPETRGWNKEFIATDISTQAIKFAKAGLYSQQQVSRGLPEDYLQRYFSKVGDQWLLDDRIRDSVEFRLMNLVDGWPYLPEFDVILLRNVLIYFQAETRDKIIRRAAELLAPDGYLILGSSEIVGVPGLIPDTLEVPGIFRLSPTESHINPVPRMKIS